MAKKAGRVSINALESTIDKSAQAVDIDFHGVPVRITRTLSLQEMLEFVASVVESCFTDEGDYMPEAFELAVRCNVLTRYANFTLPENTEKKYVFVYQSDAYKVVMDNINLDQFDDICVSIMNKVKHRKSVELNLQRQKIDELTKACSELIEKMASIFSDLESDDLLAALHVMKDQNFDEEALVKAYMQEKASVASGDE